MTNEHLDLKDYLDFHLKMVVSFKEYLEFLSQMPWMLLLVIAFFY